MRFTERPKPTGDQFTKHGKLERGSATCRSFSCCYGKYRGCYTSNCKEVEWKMNLNTSSILFQKDSNYKCQFCTKVRVPSSVVSGVWAKRDARTSSS